MLQKDVKSALQSGQPTGSKREWYRVEKTRRPVVEALEGPAVHALTCCVTDKGTPSRHAI